MNRRKFLRQGGGAMAAIAALPLLKKKKLQTEYWYTSDTYIKDGDIEGTYSIYIYHQAIRNLSSSADNLKKVRVVRYRKGGGNDTLSYEIKKVQEIKRDEKNVYIVTAELIKDGDTVATPFPLFANTIHFEVDLFLKLSLYNAKKEVVYTMSYYDDYSDMFYGCFLTTACVNHKGLADDCDELQTLRELRDNYMASFPEGQALIEEYRTVGPKMLQQINNAVNKEEILDYLYENLVVSSVKMIKSGERQEAVNYYASFVEAMKAQYI